MTYKWPLWIIGIGVVCTFAWLLQTRQPLSDEEVGNDPAISEAAYHGDYASIRYLYKLNRDESVTPLAEYWQYIGALYGIPELTQSYVEHVRQLDAEGKKKELLNIKNSDAPEVRKTQLQRQILGTNWPDPNGTTLSR